MLRIRTRNLMRHNGEVAMMMGKRGRQWPPSRGDGLTIHYQITGDADDLACFVELMGRLDYILVSPVTRMVSPYADQMERWEFWLAIPDERR